MISRRDSNKTFKKIFLYLIVGICIVFIWSPFKNFTLPLVETTGFFSSRIYTFFSKNIHSIAMYAASNDALYQENLRLNNELIEEKLRYVELAILKDDIQKYQDFSEDAYAQNIFAKRIGYLDTAVHNTFRINKGALSGLYSGELVIGKGNVVVGVLSEVGDTTSLVNLLWNGNEVSGRISASGTVVTLSGIDDGVYQAKVPHEMSFEIGDVVLYDADPRFVIGTVKKVNENESDRFKEILIHIPFHPRMIDVVRIDMAL